MPRETNYCIKSIDSQSQFFPLLNQLKLKRLFHFVSLALFPGLNFYFLFGVFLSRGPEPINLLIFSLLCIGTIFSLKSQLNFEQNNQAFFSDLFKAVLFVIIGAVLTFYLMLFFHLSAAISSGIIGLGASFLPLLKRKWGYATQLPSLMYCGTFVGMTSPHIANGLTFIICAGSIAGVLFVVSRNMFIGFGGKLGAVALWAVIITSFLFLFFL